MTVKKAKRMLPADRKAQILNAALALATDVGFMMMSSWDVARAAEVSQGLTFLYWPTMDALRADVMSEAVRTGNAAVVAQGLACGHDVARAAPVWLKEDAFALMSA